MRRALCWTTPCWLSYCRFRVGTNRAERLEAKLASLESAAKGRAIGRRQRLDAGQRRAGPDDDRPGLALFYGGLVRRKNVLGTMMHSFILMAVVTVIWAVVGYSLAFGGVIPFIGDFQFAFLDGVGSAPNPDYAGTIPQQTFMVYQLMFAIITPALISGAFAERMKFSAMLLFTMLWTMMVYFPMAHMVWGKGGLLNAFLGGKIPLFRFCRGHRRSHHLAASRPWSARSIWASASGFPSEPMKPHNLVISFIGACLLWVGWFGFNAGSALAASGLATSAFVATHFGAAAATLGMAGCGMAENGKPSILGGISGCVAGLVAITPASGFVKPFPALLIGFAAGVFCYFMVTSVKASSATTTLWMHSVSTARAERSGAILTGVFATNAVNDGLKDSAGKVLPSGLVDGNAAQVLNQCVGVLISWVLAIVGTLVILKIVDAVDWSARAPQSRRSKVWISACTVKKAIQLRRLVHGDSHNEKNRSDHPALQARRSEGSPEEHRRRWDDHHRSARSRPPKRPQRGLSRAGIRSGHAAESESWNWWFRTTASMRSSARLSQPRAPAKSATARSSSTMCSKPSESETTRRARPRFKTC